MKKAWISISTIFVGLSIVGCSNNTVYLSISEKGHELEEVLRNIKPLWAELPEFNKIIEGYRKDGDGRYKKFNISSLKQPLNCDITESVVDGFKVYSLLANDANNYDTIIFYLHGGGYVNNIISDELSLADNIAYESKAKLILPIYPLAPIGNYKQSFDFLDTLYKQIVAENKKIIVCGDSSGGGQAIATIQNLHKLGFQKPDKLILLSPWLDGSLSNPDCDQYDQKDCLLAKPGLVEAAKMWAHDLSVDDYRISPINGDLTCIPETLTIVGDNEILYPDTMIFINKLNEYKIKQKVVIGQGSMHDFAMYNNYMKPNGWVLPEAQQAQEIIINFIKN